MTIEEGDTVYAYVNGQLEEEIEPNMIWFIPDNGGKTLYKTHDLDNWSTTHVELTGTVKDIYQKYTVGEKIAVVTIGENSHETHIPLEKLERDN